MSKYQLNIGLIILAILVPLATTHAIYNDVSLTSDAVITIGNLSLNVSGSSSVIESINVGSSSFDVSLQAGSSISVTSGDKSTFTYTATSGGSSYSVNTSCNSSQSSFSLTGNDAVTVTITPTGTTCAVISGGSGSSSGSGDGGGIPYVAPIVTPSVVPNCPAGLICTPNKTLTTPTPTSIQAIANISKVFTRRLMQGSSNSDVRRLQTLLASDPSIYPEGTITGYFGKLTRKAVENFQVKYKIASPGAEGFGTVGPLTRASLQKVFGK